MEAEGGTRTVEDRTGEAATSTAVAVVFMAAGPEVGILAAGTLAVVGILAGEFLVVVDILAVGILVVVTLAAASMAAFRAGSVLHIAGAADLTVDSDHFRRGNLQILDLATAVGRVVAEPRLAGRMRGVGLGTAQARIGAIPSGPRLRSARTGRQVRSAVSEIGREEVVAAQEMVRAAGRERTRRERTPRLIRIDLLGRSWARRTRLVEEAGVPVGEPRRGAYFRRTSIGQAGEGAPQSGARHRPLTLLRLRAAAMLLVARWDEELGRGRIDLLVRDRIWAASPTVVMGRDVSIPMRIAEAPVSPIRVARALPAGISRTLRSRNLAHGPAPEVLGELARLVSEATVLDGKAMARAASDTGASVMRDSGVLIAVAGTVADGTGAATTSGSWETCSAWRWISAVSR